MKAKKIIIAILSVIGGLFLVGLVVCLIIGPPRFGPDRLKTHVLSRLDDRAEDLNLSEDQARQYAALRQRLEANLTEGAARHKDFYTRFVREMDKTEPDVEALVGDIKGELARMSESISSDLDLLAEFYNLLDQNQKQQVLENARSRLKRFDRFHRDS